MGQLRKPAAWLVPAFAGATLLALALRVGRLEYQSLWYDEGSSIFLARQSLAAITRGAAGDIHPPLYYYLLHFWMKFAGDSEYGVRFLSVGTGVLIVALLFVLGRRLSGWHIGALAALLGAVSPLLVYFSQETRMYAQVTLFGLLSTYLLVASLSLWERARVRASTSLWLVYALAAIACLYSQYIGVLALAFQGLYVLLRRPKALAPFIVSAGAAVALFLPWVYIARGSLLGWPSTDAFHAGPQLFGDAAFRYVFGLSADMTSWTAVITGAALALCLLAVVSRRRMYGHGIWLPALYLAVPLVTMFLLGVRKPVYNPKFALLALPGFVLLLAVGLSALRKVGLVAAGLLLAASGYSLYNYYANPAFARDDYRGVARVIATSQRPGDAVLLDAPGQEQVFPYYYAGGLPVIGLPADRPLVPDKTSQQLASLNGEYKRLWLVLYGTNGSDPDGYVEKWLASKDFEIQNQWFGNVRLTAFAVPSSGPAAPCSVDAVIGGFAELNGCSLTPASVASGDVWQLGLQWKATAPAPGDVKVFTHVIDGQGNIWAQRDSDPAGGARPTSGWKPGNIIDDNYGLLILPGTPPGQYQVEAGMYTADGKRLPVTAGGDGDRVVVAPHVTVKPASQPPSIDELRIPHPFEHRFGGFRLLGYGLTLVGQDAERDTFAAGDDAHLTLFWQADTPVASDAQWRLVLNPPLGHAPAGPQELPGPPLGFGTLVQQHPTSSWQPGDRYRDQYRLHLPAGAKGDFDLGLYIDGRDATPLARIHVRSHTLG